MDITIHPGKLMGSVTAPPSKSMAHRMLICAAFSHHPCTLLCTESNADIDATAECLRALGADILHTERGFHVTPVKDLPAQAQVPCGESGSTLRFLLPIAGALGVDATFHMQGRLPHRPLSPLWEEMERMGCRLTRPTANTIRCTGKLRPGEYIIDGSVSSQFITGLKFALPMISGHTALKITGDIQSKPYLDMTDYAISQFFLQPQPKTMDIEGDWSSTAFWLAANALANQLHVEGLRDDSLQGDRRVVTLLSQLQANTVISAKDIPDLIPILSIVAAAGKGAAFTDIERLRLKESDRVAAILAMLQSLGGHAEATENTLTVHGTGLRGGIVDSFMDHRIAMAAAIAATVCRESVTISAAECVKKSYPSFWEEYARLGGKYEKHLW